MLNATTAHALTATGSSLHAEGPTHRHVIELPSIRSLVENAGRVLLEATVIPLGLFYLFLHFVGVWGAVAAALAWSYTGIVRRLVTHQPIPGMLLLGALLLTARSIVTVLTGSMFLYFLQPTLGTFLVAGLFLASVPLGRPLTERLARDFCPMPEGLLGTQRLRTFFLRISLLWGLVYCTNGAATLWLLLTRSVGEYLLVKTVASASLTALAIGASYLWFRWSMRHEGIVLRWAKHHRG